MVLWLTVLQFIRKYHAEKRRTGRPALGRGQDMALARRRRGRPTSVKLAQETISMTYDQNPNKVQYVRGKIACKRCRP